MPLFLPAYTSNSRFETKDTVPSGLVLKFQYPSDRQELYRFIDIFDIFLKLNQKHGALEPSPIITNADGKIVPPQLLYLIPKYAISVRLSFVLFGDYFRDVLRAYCVQSITLHQDEVVREGFKNVMKLFALEIPESHIH